MTENERRHSERQRRIYDRGGESGKKIKAISCERSAKYCYTLNILLRFESSRRLSILSRAACATGLMEIGGAELVRKEPA